MRLQSFLVLAQLGLLVDGKRHARHSSLAVSAPSGTYLGLINGTAPNVRQFLSVPYAEPPTGERRWLPPVKKTTDSTETYDATRFPLSCTQYLSNSPTVYNKHVPEWLPVGPGQHSTVGEVASGSGEDCLYLGVWTPTGTPEKLPVVVFLTGGAFFNGGVDIPYQLPTEWVQRTQSHIAVTINYRVSILGFPNAAGLEDKNVGFLDQRAALEWVRDNIAAFGGDPDKITLWGQSAGAISAEYQSFYKYDDPIATGYIMSSGTALLGQRALKSTDTAGAMFQTMAREVGCGDVSTPAEELECMRKVPADKLVKLAVTLPSLNFYPAQDEKTVFKNYTDRYERGLYAKLPAIYSTTANDGVAAVPFTGRTPQVSMVNGVTNYLFKCPAQTSALLRSQHVPATYRYEFAGDFENISPMPWLKAYHSADLPFVFGTHDDYRGASTPYEYEVSEAMQDHFLEFMKDPVGVGKALDWPTVADGEVLLFGKPGGSAVERVEAADVFKGCDAKDETDGFANVPE